MRRLSIALGLAVTLLVAGAAAAAPVASAFSSRDLKGRWHGKLHQSVLRPFTVTVTIASLHDAARNPVRYSGLDCRGTWAYLGRRSGTFRFREVITTGKSSTCKGAGTVSLVPLSSRALRYRFRGGGVTSAGVIGRVRTVRP